MFGGLLFAITISFFIDLICDHNEVRLRLRLQEVGLGFPARTAMLSYIIKLYYLWLAVDRK